MPPRYTRITTNIPRLELRLQPFTDPPELVFYLQRWPSLATNRVYRALVASAYAIQGRIRQSLQAGGKSGRVYPWKVATKAEKPDLWVGPMPNGFVLPAVLRPKPHIASAPGQAPATDTGLLVKRWIVEQEKAYREVTVGTTLKYAAYLEYGALNAKIDPRPSFRPAVNAEIPYMLARVNAALGAMIKNPTLGPGFSTIL
jgi:hypothetical protein